MENPELRVCFEKALESIVQKFKDDQKCQAALLVGSLSHDFIWEWSDLELLLIYDDSYKGPAGYSLLEQDVQVVVSIKKRSAFKEYLTSTNVSDYWFCALSKSTMLFCKDMILEEFFEDIFYIGERDQEVEMLLGFSEAVYYLNKAEKNFYVKKNSDNAIYFIPDLVKGIAWLEVARDRSIPEREIIAQARELQPQLFAKIYDALYVGPVTDELIEKILQLCHRYLEEHTLQVYRPIISYLQKHRTLKEFSLKTRKHGFGINYQWLYRMGIVERYVEPVKINNQDQEFFQIGYRLKDEYA